MLAGPAATPSPFGDPMHQLPYAGHGVSLAKLVELFRRLMPPMPGGPMPGGPPMPGPTPGGNPFA